MEGANEPNRKPITLFTLNSHEDLSQFSKGCDADIGGTSTVNLALEQLSPAEKPFAKFWGEMHLGVRPEVQGLVRGGYAGFWSKVSMQGGIGESINDRALWHSVVQLYLATFWTTFRTIGTSLCEFAVAETLARETLTL